MDKDSAAKVRQRWDQSEQLTTDFLEHFVNHLHTKDAYNPEEARKGSGPGGGEWTKEGGGGSTSTPKIAPKGKEGSEPISALASRSVEKQPAQTPELQGFARAYALATGHNYIGDPDFKAEVTATPGTTVHHAKVVEAPSTTASPDVQLSWESAPGATTNDMLGIKDAPIEQKREYHRAISAVLNDVMGKDIISQQFGMWTKKSFEAPGSFQGHVSPGSQGVTAATQLPLPEKWKQTLDAMECVRGALLRQDAAAWHHPLFQKGRATQAYLIPTLKWKGELYRGSSHKSAFENMPPEVQKQFLADKGNQMRTPYCYTKPDGTIVDRFEGMKYAQDNGLLQEGMLKQPLLISEHLQTWASSPRMQSNPADANLIDVRIGRTLTDEETLSIAKAISKVNPFYSPIGTKDGFRILNVADATGVDNIAFKQLMKSALEEADLPNIGELHIYPVAAESGYIENDWKKDTHGEGYRTHIASLNRPDLVGEADKLFASLGPRIDRVQDDFARRYGWKPNYATRFWDRETRAAGTQQTITATPGEALHVVDGRRITSGARAPLATPGVRSRDEFVEAEHPRGQPKNAGEFAKTPEASAKPDKVGTAKHTAASVAEALARGTKTAAPTKTTSGADPAVPAVPRSAQGNAFIKAVFAQHDPKNAVIISPRLLRGKKNTEPPGSGNFQDTDLESFKRGERYKDNVNLLKTYPFLNVADKAGTTDDVLEKFVEQAKGNLLWLYDNTPPEVRERSQAWYAGARHIIDVWSKQYNLPDTAIAGCLAALSPQKDWYMNVSLAERILDIVVGKQGAAFVPGRDFTASPQMLALFDKYIAVINKDKKTPPEKKAEKIAAMIKTRDALKGKKLSQIENPTLKAWWVRTYDEAHNPHEYRELLPEGRFADIAKNLDGKPTSITWGPASVISKAMDCLVNSDILHISKDIGDRHKVRSFFNNMISPNNPKGSVTIDTHAVAACHMRPLGGSAIEVFHNFGNAPNRVNGKKVQGAYNSAVTGNMGVYPVYVEAYRRAAKERGVLPDQMQSIAWESIRSLFPEEFKIHGDTGQIDNMWKDYQSGKFKINDVRKRIAALPELGNVAQRDWSGYGVGDNPSDGFASYARNVAGP